MAKQSLVESLISDSVKLVDELDKQGHYPSNALRYFFSVAEEWRLLIAGHSFNQFLPKDEGQVVITKAIGSANLDSLTVADVKVVRTDDTTLIATKMLVKTSPVDVRPIHFHDLTFNGIFIREICVLRAV